ncbi:MAG: amino acid adenylation domain-containing protein [Ferruginibacter sp.]
MSILSSTDIPLLPSNKTLSYPANKNIIELFEEQAEKLPQHIAVVFEDCQMSYSEINAKSNQFAHYLLSKGIKQGSLIAICIDRSTEMMIAILGILKTGAAYVPIDASYPTERIRYMLEDTNAPVVISGSKISSKLAPLKERNIINIDEEWILIAQQPSNNPSLQIAPDDLAYVIYTSGSTGVPKGVLVQHNNVVSLVKEVDYVSLTNENILLSTGSSSFDATTFEYWGMLLNGGQLILCAERTLLDTLLLKEEIRARKVNIMWFTAGWLNQLAETDIDIFEGLKTILAGGEKLSEKHIEKIRRSYPSIEIINGYGPTENTTFSLTFNITNTHFNNPIPIGKPLNNRTAYILDKNNCLVNVGVAGEICVGGAGIARGYLNHPELTAEKFINNPFDTIPDAKLYKTGDTGRWLPDGNIEYLGRVDDQVKIRGHRIELGEIEAILQQFELVTQAVVVAKKDKQNSTQLTAYIIPNGSYEREKIIDFLQAKLPPYMIPSFWVSMKDFPLTANGKTDKINLPAADIENLIANDYMPPENEMEKLLIEMWQEFFGIKRIGILDNFFTLGGHSLLAQRTVSTLKSKFNYTLPITKLYQYPTIKGIVQFLMNKEQTFAIKNKPHREYASTEVAVIGMAGRFPGANTIEELWEVLKNGKETIRFFKKTELDASISAEQKTDPDYVAARGVIDDADKFDAAFFGLNPKLAEVMDPQQRIFLEIAWEVLEQTGHVPQKYQGTVGVYAGTGTNTYYYNNVQSQPATVKQVGSFQAMTVNEKDYISSRTAYQLNLKGPAVSVYSACSTSLLAIVQAVESIRKGQCDVAIAGGASITSPVNSGHLYQEGAMLSKDGHCRSFDAAATGTVFSDGAAVVLLKSVEAAQIDGDTIYAVIKGVGLNNDGSGKGSFTAPSSEGQAGAIAMAINDARIDAATISYVETHGTGTPLGDPIEIEGLKMAFGHQSRNQFCAIGTVKSNMGHLTAAAGVAGLIKTVLSLHHRLIPPSLGYYKPNPNIDFSNSPFFVNTKLVEWHSETARRAGVSSFGVGGTNVHVVLEEFVNETPVITPGRPVQLITWSAKTNWSLENYGKKLGNYLKQHTTVSLADTAYTLQLCRADFECRQFIVAENSGDFCNTIPGENTILNSDIIKEAPGDIVFMFPGQGSQYVNMGLDLYNNESVFRDAVDECAAILQSYIGSDIRKIIFVENAGSEAEELLKDTRITQPAIFVIEYALGKLWMSWGIEASVYFGHSIGEFVAAHFAGIFSLEDALKLIAIRGKMVSELPTGSMLSVKITAKELSEIIPDDLDIAAINSTNLCVVAGKDEDVAVFAKLLNDKAFPNKKLLTSHAFHSFMMDALMEQFEKIVSGIQMHRPQRGIVSTVTGKWLTDAEAIDPHYWATHLRATVLFADATETILKLENVLFLEVGPGNTLSTLVKQLAGNRTSTSIASLYKSKPLQSEYASTLKALGQLWANGLQPDWEAFYSGQKRNKINLPTYSFDKKYCWIAPAVKHTVDSPHTFPLQNPVSFSEEIKSTPGIMRKDELIIKIKQLLEDASGIDTDNASVNMSFVEMGFDSLLLTQMTLTLKKEFGVPLTFRQLNEEYATLELLAKYLDEKLPVDKFQPVAPNHHPANQLADINYAVSNHTQPGAESGLELIAQQLQILTKQIALIQGNKPRGNNSTAFQPVMLNKSPNDLPAKMSDLTAEEALEIKKPFGATARIEKHSTELTGDQKIFLQQLTKNYTKKTQASKSYAQQHRPYMADPRVVSGFKPLTKDIVYPLVVNRSSGSKLWDIDGNEYIDVLNGFGSCMFGYQPDFIKKALHEQVENGYEVGPQHELAGEVSKLVCEFTGFDRAALCSTGSEAVLGTMRVARTVTGRSLIVAFTGSYHGIVDEVIVRGTKKLKSFPAAPGIMPEAVQNMLILDYGTEEALKIIKERAHELAAVLVEPVQSRRPEYRPVEFLKQLREITIASGTVLIFDEVITGFRMHPGGAQALLGIKADIASYGKVVGGGLPIGVIAGKKELMDALDGGFWQYGDNSFPEVGVTYFAGTFVRHPLALAAAKVSLLHMKKQGPDLQRKLNATGDKIAELLNTEFEKRALPFFVAQFGSLWKVKFHEEVPYSELLFTLLRLKGIHVWDGFPCFVTEAHTDEDTDRIIKLFVKSVDEMIAAGFFKSNILKNKVADAFGPGIFSEPPMPGARLGRDEAGNPAWFIADKKREGKYLLVK